MHKHRDYPEVCAWLLQRLRFSPTPVTRDVLAAELVHFARVNLGLAWTEATAARRLREAFNRLERDGHAVLSDGTGYRLARTSQIQASDAMDYAREWHARWCRAGWGTHDPARDDSPAEGHARRLYATADRLRDREMQAWLSPQVSVVVDYTGLALMVAVCLDGEERFAGPISPPEVGLILDFLAP